ncbi:MAG: hypothetical protein OXG81_08560 [Acidobacteria bacterium]|nr:hypothetical protein [Acidobacteriota bacterium]
MRPRIVGKRSASLRLFAVSRRNRTKESSCCEPFSPFPPAWSSAAS